MPYLGTGEHAGLVSDLAYHNSVMVALWSSLAAADARLATMALRRFPPKPRTTAWATYVRCHDDIGWAVDDADAAAVGWDGWSHRAFLSDWYSGDFPGSPARGLVFQHNPATGDRRISGTAASLAGVEAAEESGDPVALDLAVRRLVLLHTAILGFGGLPLIWMGDELALTNDHGWAGEPDHGGDNRWAHRPRMPWAALPDLLRDGTPAHLVRTALQQAHRVRASLPAMHGAIEANLLDPVNPAVLAWLRPHPTGPVVALHNMSAVEQPWPRDRVPLSGDLLDALSGPPSVEDSRVVLAPYAVLWLVSGS